MRARRARREARRADALSHARMSSCPSRSCRQRRRAGSRWRRSPSRRATARRWLRLGDVADLVSLVLLVLWLFSSFEVLDEVIDDFLIVRRWRRAGWIVDDRPNADFERHVDVAVMCHVPPPLCP